MAFGVAGAFEPREPPGHPTEIGLGNSRSIVQHLDVDQAVCRDEGQADYAAGRRVALSIFKQINECLGK